MKAQLGSLGATTNSSGSAKSSSGGNRCDSLEIDAEKLGGDVMQAAKNALTLQKFAGQVIPGLILLSLSLSWHFPLNQSHRFCRICMDEQINALL